MAEKKITKGDLTKVFWRLQLMNVCLNYERMQSIGFLTAFIPVLKRLYSGADKETKAKAMKRHLEYFNSQANCDALILGITAAVEENTDASEKKSVSAIKTGLMGPLAGIGDSILKGTYLPICGSIGAGLALQGNVLGAIIMFLMYNVVNFATRYYFIRFGYEKGTSIVAETGSTGIMQRIANMANVVGLMVIGALIVSSVKLNIATVLQVGKSKLVIQDLLNGIVPNLMPLLFTFLIYYITKKLGGKHTALIILAIMVVSVILKMMGVL